MKNNLRNYFPMIQTKETIREKINENETLLTIWEKWNTRRKEDFLDWCSGAKGVKMLYDSFFKEVMNPEYTPERMNSFLSVLLQKKVKVLKVLPVESTRIANEQSLVIMDIVVELEDGSIADIEVQKIGYAFPGQRAACYSADLLLRQYKRVREEKGDKFRYIDVKPVFTIILMEESTGVFKENQEDYVYRIQPKIEKNTKLDLLQTFIFVPLDIFKKKYHYRGITNKLDAWLVFLSIDEPEDIIQLITQYPEFQSMYETIYQMCLNVERVMQMYSKELEILDRNTVVYMIDEMQGTIDEKEQELEEMNKKLGVIGEKLQAKDSELQAKANELQAKDSELQAKANELQAKDSELQAKDSELQAKDSELQAKDSELQAKDDKLQEKDRQIEFLQKQIRKLQEGRD